MGKKWEEFRQKIVNLQSDLARFQVDFLDRHSFKDFVDYTSRDIQGYSEVCITGYFSEIIRDSLENMIRLGQNVRLIRQEFPAKLSKNDRKELEVLEKLVNAGVKIKINHRTHARLFIAHNPKLGEGRGLVVIGSFDFNSDCYGKERYDAGIKTRHPDLVKSSVELFDQIWNERESMSLEDFVKKGKS